ncbi:MAG: hypothetical protein Ct9H90mP2_06450 [Dehalococcoidia bacterium]|nr:MAG: hypothetical protein Ct9H90mP2_06450 [Dehalococcoidia bacterium]
MGVSGDKGSIGYFGYAYYIENESQLKLLSVDGGTGCVLQVNKQLMIHHMLL